MRNLLPLVQVPPRGLWNTSGQPKTVPLDVWADARLPGPITIDELVLRYLRAFGPATAADVTAWCRLTGMREVIERLRPRLRTLRDERNRELFDVEDGLLPDEDTPAPVRFLPEYDNVLLSHQDRTRIAPEGLRPLSSDAGLGWGSVLVDGFLSARWRREKSGDVTLDVDGPSSAVSEEFERLREFLDA